MLPESPKFLSKNKEWHMIPQRIVDHLKSKGIPFIRRLHDRAVSAQQLAHSVHVTGYQVAKTVLFQADGERWMAVLPAPALVDTERLAEMLDRGSVRLLEEDEFADAFPGCELGAEPPFGSLFGIPVLMDESLRAQDRMVVRAGSHHEVLELLTQDFERLERPRTGTFALVPETQRYLTESEASAPM
jgi:Ala-tRNA(Pro) deacylase